MLKISLALYQADWHIGIPTCLVAAKKKTKPVERQDDTMKTPTINEVLANPATSYWLANAINAALQRDPVDAANDAELLARVLNAHSLGVQALGRELVRPTEAAEQAIKLMSTEAIFAELRSRGIFCGMPVELPPQDQQADDAAFAPEHQPLAHGLGCKCASCGALRAAMSNNLFNNRGL